MKTTIFHGTNAENAQNILKNGFDDIQNLWECSACDNSYFWNVSKCEEYDELADNIDYAKNRAFESAIISASLKNTNFDYVCVFQIELDNEHLQDDDSCENMNECSQIDNIKLNKLIENGDAKIVKVHKFNYYRTLKLFYISSLKDNNYIYLDEFLNNVELNALDMISNIEYIEELWAAEEYLGGDAIE